LAYAVDDSYQVKREYMDNMMLRVVDVESAVGACPAGLGAPEGALSIAISDAAAPWPGHMADREFGRETERLQGRWRQRGHFDGGGHVCGGVRRVHEGKRG